ncbi:MAG: formate C-acetyltransferase [Treponema sp.]|uniref:formate C-acetyltransferase n=1 Tax=Treponema sp. TaxID=166 RepID=UPI001DF98D50|nr:formate C-acetyltransferase [Treponema sp.]MBS7310733.1 formate C-acetyltransferase [Treponema sp.]MCI5696067.1 formate C-acetyltransferase [Spirochaetia bacterium]MDY5885234.1 formate C-acetyltransferase [Treponema sp.]
MIQKEEWNGFEGRLWKEEVNVRDFIQNNYTPYDGDEKFLAGPTAATQKLFDELQRLQKEEHNKVSVGKDGVKRTGVLDMDTNIVTSLTAHEPGYICPDGKNLEKVVGLQTDKPLKRAFMPYGGINMAVQSCEMYGYDVDPELKKIFTEYHKTHNQGVFDVYTPEHRAVRSAHILTGLPDTYGRGRIVGDYRRVALYGIDQLIKFKQADFNEIGDGTMTNDVIRLREEVTDQINALKGIKAMAAKYGYDISGPAKNAREAFQWLYFGYLAAIKTQNGAAMSVGRVSTFLDIYIERDIKAGILTEEEAQELVDHIVMKFRMVRFARIESYNQLFSGDPIWATLEVGGLGIDGRSMVTKNDFRFLHTLENMGPSPEPNMTVLYSKRLPDNFRKYCAKISIDTSSIQYENDEVMRPIWGDDYSICCCVSATQTGKEMQFFGARANLAKALLYAFNGGKDECLKKGIQIGPNYEPIDFDVIDASNYDIVVKKYLAMLEWLAGVYVNVLNAIHYMHDKYYYEAAELALEDTDVKRTFATGIAGFSHVVDSLSAMKYAKVKVIREKYDVVDKKTGKVTDTVTLVKDFEIEGDFPRYGQDDDRADDIAVWLLKTFMGMIKKHPTYRNAEPSTSILTITSNVVYGKATGALPDGRKAGEPFSPGANPSYGAETKGLVKSLNSVAKLPYHYALDGISNTQTINPSALGHEKGEQIDNLVNILDGYFSQGSHHLNVNVFGVEKLKDCQAHPEKPEYANFTVRVSGYAVRFINLTKEQQDDVIARTCHASL